jgi:hypothetical protein
MAEPISPFAYPSELPGGGDPLPRCCERHPDWSTLTQHLVDGFPEIPVGDLVREVRRAKDAVEQVDLPGPEALEIGELIVRHQLMMRAGKVRDAARLDPERHMRAVP